VVVGAAWCCGFDREGLCTRAPCCYVCAVACVIRCTKWLFCVPREPCPSLRAGFVVCPPIKHVDAARLLMLRVCACVEHHESVVVRPAAAASTGPAKLCRSHPSTQVHVTAAGCVSTTSQPRFCGLRAIRALYPRHRSHFVGHGMLAAGVDSIEVSTVSSWRCWQHSTVLLAVPIGMHL
jgi:hypothetical protein